MKKLFLLAILTACAGSPTLPRVRFANAPPVTVVDDRRDVATAPAKRTVPRELYHFDGNISGRLDDALALREQRRALGVNAVDEVPDSTWFTNRIGVRDVSLDEIRRGPPGIGSPEARKPWTIVSTKVGGVNVGFIIKDARGEKYLLKFDEHDAPEAETAAGVIINRILWTCGYNVPEDHVVYLRREELVLAKDAVVKDVFGHKRPLTRNEFDRLMARVVVDEDGRIRGFASRMLPGKALGGHRQRGVRADDPNDRIEHERRRDMRGAYAIYAWLDQGDVKEDNTLDMWVEDPADPKRHYVKHYLIDFGKGLGVAAWVNQERRSGHEYGFDPHAIFGSLVTAGLRERSWEDREVPAPRRGLGMFSANELDPGGWKPYAPTYTPFFDADRFDKYWASKLIIRLTREHLRAAVDAGRLTDARTVEYLVDTLAARQRKTAAYWFARTSPLERFEVSERELCFEDLAIVHDFSTPASTRYYTSVFDHGGSVRIGRQEILPFAARTCAAIRLGSGEGYTIVKIETLRASGRTTIFVHVARDPATSAPRVIGIWRS